MKRILVSLVLLAAMVVAHPAYGQEVKVVTTFSILEDFVRQVGGDRIVVSSLIPPGSDPHTWEPTPREARMVAQADLIVANGGGFDDWLLDLMKNTAKDGSLLIMASEGLEVSVPLDAHDDDGHPHHHHGDPHYWLDVTNAISYVQQITRGLLTASPTNASYFQERSMLYIEELMALHEWMVDEFEKIPRENKVIVTYHNAFSFLAEGYGFEVAEFLVTNPEAEPSPRDLARLVDLLRGTSSRALFREPQLTGGTRYMEALAKEIGGELYMLYSDSLSAEVATYVDMMKYNTRILVEALE